MAALVLACKQIWGHVRTCATAVKMADLKYYSLSSSFLKVSFFFFAVCRTRHYSTALLQVREPHICAKEAQREIASPCGSTENQQSDCG